MAEPPKADESATGTEPPVAKTYPPRPIPSVDPRPITLADFEDERPALLARFTPKSRWLALGAAAVGVAFVLGLIVGRGTAPIQARELPASSFAPAPTEATKAAAVAPAPVLVPSPEAESAEARPKALEAPSAAAAPAVSLATPEPPPPAASAAEGSKPAASSKGLAPFNTTAAKTNLGNAAARVRGCKDKTVPPGSASAVITFAPSGRVSDVTVTTPTYATGAIGSCIVSKLKTARVPPFSGAPETVKKVVAIR